MNELIEQFERESGLEIYGLGQDRVKWKSVVEKFAKLIVADCADFVAAGEFGDPGTAKQLMEYFGVEE